MAQASMKRQRSPEREPPGPDELLIRQIDFLLLLLNGLAALLRCFREHLLIRARVPHLEPQTPPRGGGGADRGPGGGAGPSRGSRSVGSTRA